MIIKYKAHRINTRYAWMWWTEKRDAPVPFCDDCMEYFCGCLRQESMDRIQFFLHLRYGEKLSYTVPFATEAELDAVMEKIDEEVL